MSEAVDRVYALYDSAKKLNGASDEEASEAYKELCSYIAPDSDPKAKTLARDFVPALLSSFSHDVGCVESGINGLLSLAIDEDVNNRIYGLQKLAANINQIPPGVRDTFARLLLESLSSSGTQEKVQQQQIAAKQALFGFAKAYPDVVVKEIWQLSSPETQRPALAWVASEGKKIIGNQPSFAENTIQSLSQIVDLTVLDLALDIILKTDGYQANSFNEGRLTALLDGLVSKLDDLTLQSATTMTNNGPLQELIAYQKSLVKWAIIILTRGGQPTSLLTYIQKNTLPQVLGAKPESIGPTFLYSLRLCAEGCVCKHSGSAAEGLIEPLSQLVLKIGLSTSPGETTSVTVNNDEINNETLVKYATAPLIIGSETNGGFRFDWTAVEPILIALYVAILKSPNEHKELLDNGEYQTALKELFGGSQTDGKIAQQRIDGTEKWGSKNKANIRFLEKVKQQCTNSSEIIRQLLKPPAQRSKVPVKIKFSWRQHAPAAAVPTPPAAPAAKSKAAPAPAGVKVIGGINKKPKTSIIAKNKRNKQNNELHKLNGNKKFRK